MMRWKNPEVWLRGLFATFIGGGAGAVSSTFIAVLKTPEQYNITNGLANLLYMVFGTFVVSGIVNACFYLQKSPLPDIMDEEETALIRKAVAETKAIIEEDGKRKDDK
jgi:hypothetical protein